MNDKTNDTIKVWAKNFFNLVVNFPGSPEQVCDCEGCNSILENRPASVDRLLDQLEDILGEFDIKKDEEDEDE